MSAPISLCDAIRQACLYHQNNMHVALPAEIISYDFQKQKASVQPLLNKAWADLKPNDPPAVMPVLANVPVIFPRSGGASLTFPVTAGDTCLLVFIERSTDLWLSEGGQVTPDDPRKFDLSDAVAIMGLFPFVENSQADNNNDVLLTYAGSNIRIQKNGDIQIKTSNKVAIGTATDELLDILDKLMTALKGPTVMGPTLGAALNPVFTTQVTAIQAKLTNIRGTIT